MVARFTGCPTGPLSNTKRCYLVPVRAVNLLLVQFQTAFRFVVAQTMPETGPEEFALADDGHISDTEYEPDEIREGLQCYVS